MKKNIYNLVIILILCIILVLILTLSKDIIETVLFGFTIWKENIFTSLFPIFIVAEFLMNYGFVELIGELTKKIIGKLFYLPGEASFVIIASMLSGFPSSAKYIKQLLGNNCITEDEAQYLLCFTHFSNPLFVTGVIGTSVFNNRTLGIIILLVHIITNFIIALIIRKKRDIKISPINLKYVLRQIEKKRSKTSFIKTLTDAINKTINTLLLLLGIIITFLVLSKILNNVIDTSPLNQAILSGILEMTQGIKYTSLLNIPINLKAAIITALISFGGISIHLQIISILSEVKIKYKYYLICRIIHAVISSTLVYFITSFYCV